MSQNHLKNKVINCYDSLLTTDAVKYIEARSQEMITANSPNTENLEQQSLIENVQAHIGVGLH